MHRVLRVLLLMLGLAARPAVAIDPGLVERLAFGESDEKVDAVGVLVASGDERAPALLQALADGTVQTADKRVLIVTANDGTTPATTQTTQPPPPSPHNLPLTTLLP